MKVWDVVEHGRPVLTDMLNSLESAIGMEWMLALKVKCTRSLETLPGHARSVLVVVAL